MFVNAISENGGKTILTKNNVEVYKDDFIVLEGSKSKNGF